MRSADRAAASAAFSECGAVSMMARPLRPCGRGVQNLAECGAAWDDTTAGFSFSRWSPHPVALACGSRSMIAADSREYRRDSEMKGQVVLPAPPFWEMIASVFMWKCGVCTCGMYHRKLDHASKKTGGCVLALDLRVHSTTCVRDVQCNCVNQYCPTADTSQSRAHDLTCVQYKTRVRVRAMYCVRVDFRPVDFSRAGCCGRVGMM